jgi:hypothetical protein
MLGFRVAAWTCLGAFGWPVWGAPALTTIQDVLYKADGTRFNGVAIIEWKGFEAADATQVPTQLVTVQIRSGNLRVQLVPTTNVSNGAYYSVRYNSDGRVQFSEIWAVRPSATPLRLRDVRISRDSINAPPALLQALPGFVDGETPSGVVDGSNAAFTLSQAPAPASSLALYRNGVLQKAGLDFTLSGATITFAAEAVPRSGDILLASYRLAEGSTFPSGAPVPEILCSAAGEATSSLAPVTLGTCTIPASALTDGSRIEARYEYYHQGAAQGFTAQLTWGGSVALARVVAPGEAFLSGRTEFGLAGARAQWSTLSWGVVTAFAGSAGEAEDSWEGGITLAFLGQLNQPGTGTLRLKNYTVLRYPAR